MELDTLVHLSYVLVPVSYQTDLGLTKALIPRPLALTSNLCERLLLLLLSAQLR